MCKLSAAYASTAVVSEVGTVVAEPYDAEFLGEVGAVLLDGGYLALWCHERGHLFF